MPYVVASQTIPIIALAPLIVFAFGANVTSVVVIATYLTFFPVTIAMIRGLRAPDPRALELMRSYAAGRSATYWKLRLPASMPYLFTALKIAATTSSSGRSSARPGGSPTASAGPSSTSTNHTSPAPKLWAAILVAPARRTFFVMIRALELVALRGRPGAAEG